MDFYIMGAGMTAILGLIAYDLRKGRQLCRYREVVRNLRESNRNLREAIRSRDELIQGFADQLRSLDATLQTATRPVPVDIES